MSKRDLLKSIYAFSIDRNGVNKPIQDNYSSFYEKTLIGTVRNYDPEKDYGFIYISDINDEISFKVAKLEKFEV